MSDFPKTPNAGLDLVTYGSLDLRNYHARVEMEQRLSASFAAIDFLLGQVTGSHQTVMHISGALAGFVGAGNALGSGQFIGPLVVADSDRIITKVSIVQRNSGSGGVTQVDVRTANGILPTADRSIFAANQFKAILSGAVDPNGFVGQTTTFVPASASWPRGWTLGATLDSAASVASDLTVTVHWKPSASFYGAGILP